MIEKNISSRIQHKHDIEANWAKALNFIPKAGEIIIYDIDENNSIPRIKIGDGERTINNLPFSISGENGFSGSWNDLIDKPFGDIDEWIEILNNPEFSGMFN